jgi:hypothetical protein
MGIPTQNNVAQIAMAEANIEQNAKATNAILSTVLGSIKKIAEFKSSNIKLSDVQYVENIVTSYKGMINSIITSLCQDDNGQARDLHALLGAIKDPDKSTKDKTVLKYTTIDAALQLPKVIDSMFELVDTISGTKFGFKTILKFKVNVKLLKFAINGLFKDLINAFSDVDANSNMDKIISCLVKQPDTIEQYINSVSDQTNTSSNTSSNTKTDPKTITKQGQLGLLDVFAKTFEIVNMINSLKVPNFIKVKSKMIQTRLALKMLISDLIKWFDKNIDNNTQEKLSLLEDVIVGKKDNNGVREGGLQSIITSLVGMFSLAKRIKLNISSLISIKLSLFAIGSLINAIQNLIPKFDALSDKTIIDNIKGTERTMQSITNIIASLKTMAMNIILTGLMILPAIASMMLIMVFIPLLGGFIWALNGLTKIVGVISENTTDNIQRISGVFTSLLLVGAAIILFALATPLFITALQDHFWPFIGFLVGSMVLLGITMAVAGFIAKKAALASLKLSTSIIVMMGALLMSALVILLASATADRVNSWDTVGKIALMIGGMIALSAIMILLGVALSAASAFIGMATVGITPLVVLLGMLVAAGLAMLVLGNFDFDFGEYNKEKNEGVGIKGNVGKIINFADWVFETIGDRKRKNVRQAKRGKQYIKHISKTVVLIKDIATTLENISKITLNNKIIDDKIKFIFGVVNDINTKIFGDENGEGGLLSPDETKSKVEYNTWDFIIPFKGLAKAINNRNNDKNVNANKKLNRINKVIRTLNNIGNSLTSIQDLDINEGKITTQITNIFTFVGKLEGIIQRNMSAKTVELEVNGSTEIVKKATNRQLNKSSKKLNRVDGVITNIQNICNALNDAKNITLDDKAKDAIKNNVKKMFVSIDEISKIITGNSDVAVSQKTIDSVTPLIDYIGKLNESFKTTGDINSDNLKQNVENYIKFVDKVNTIDVEKTQKTAQMFEQMANFSNSIKGDFDKLAESLSDKLLPVLTEIKNVMSTVPEKLDIGFQSTAASIGATNAAPTKENYEAQIKRENPNLSKEDVDLIVRSRLNERAKADANGVAAKIDELMSLLKGFGGSNVVVKTI